MTPPPRLKASYQAATGGDGTGTASAALGAGSDGAASPAAGVASGAGAAVSTAAGSGATDGRPGVASAAGAAVAPLGASGAAGSGAAGSGVCARATGDSNAAARLSVVSVESEPKAIRGYTESFRAKARRARENQNAGRSTAG